ncbi:MAG: DUF1264 domain-containing protein [Planctomycetia bacterium]|nr:DUF1264 domain-containing protein [Planctomycetia bacterium]
MNRRELFGVCGAVGAGLVAGGQEAIASGHGSTRTSKFMAPASNHHLHFCGIHVAKRDPKIQLITQHYCGPCGDEMHQCLLFDSLEKDAKLLGVEYIVSDRLYRELPETEKRFWHPHTYEVLAGGLISPGMSADDEMTFMKALLTTWGKSWHTWPDPTTDVPLGEPMLMWSLTGDGQDDKRVIAERDKMFGVSTRQIRDKRIAAIGFEVPRVPPPKSLDTVGRQWTASGADRPSPVRQ